MKDLIQKYTAKLVRDRIAEPDSIRFTALDDTLISGRDDAWQAVFAEVLAGLNVMCLLFAKPSLPFPDTLIQRAGTGEERIVPKDSEARTFLHDIPFIRSSDLSRGAQGGDLSRKVIDALKERKAVIIEGLGVVAAGSLTVEQAYISYSTIFHTTFVKYLLDILYEGFTVSGERELMEKFRQGWLEPCDARGLDFAEGQLVDPEEIQREMWRIGRATVERGLVDSFFGNISYFDGSTIYISQTASSLDELEGNIDPVPLDGSSTAGLSASSELPAHTEIYRASDYHAVLHGHPRFSVIMSMFCEEQDCDIKDCSRLCNRPRETAGIPVVAGEPGAGGLARTVPRALKTSGICIVYGHGVFSAGKTDFKEAFVKMVEAELSIEASELMTAPPWSM